MQIHITPKLLQHKRGALPPPASALNWRSNSISMSILGPVQHRFARTGGYRRDPSTAPGAAAGAADGAAGAALSQSTQGLEALGLEEREREEEAEEEDGEILQWDKVRDPPLNIFAGSRPTNAASEAGSGPRLSSGPGEREGSEWVDILIGDAAEGEEGLVEVPSALRDDPTELAAAMVALMSGLYR